MQCIVCNKCFYSLKHLLCCEVISVVCNLTLSPQEDSRSEGCSRCLVHSSFSQGSHSCLTFVVIGETGQGKSTLINSLMGEPVAKEGTEYVRETTSLNFFQFKKNDIQIQVWDTPGFTADPKEDENTLQLMVHNIKNVDLVLYCIRMDSRRRPKQHEEIIVKITEIFTKNVWSHCLFVLTFANCTIGDPYHKSEQFSRICVDWEHAIRKQLQNLTSLNSKELENIRAVPAGTYCATRWGTNPWVLPDRKDWLESFWVECSFQINDKSLPALLQFIGHSFRSKIPRGYAIKTKW